MSEYRKKLIGITTDLKNDHNSIEESYSKAVEYHGGIPVLIPTIGKKKGYLKDIVSKIDGLLLPGSRDMDPGFYSQKPHPKINPMSIDRTNAEYAVLEESLKRKIPVLGICGGMQLVNVFYGGSLHQDIASILPDALDHEKGAVHDVRLTPNTVLGAKIGNDFNVKSYHHQAVDKVGNGLKVNAKSPDGIVEGFEKMSDRVLGIQWHPELEFSDVSKAIFEIFLTLD